MIELRRVPHDCIAEDAVLGAILLDGARAFDAAAEVIGEDDFHLHANRVTWRAIASVVKGGGEPDAVTVFGALRAAGAVDDAGGLARISDLAPAAPSAASVVRYARLVADASRRRRLLATVDRLAAAALDPAQPVDETLAAAGRELDAIADTEAGSDDDSALLAGVDEAVRFIDRRAQAGDAVSGLATGLVDIDALTHGFEPGQLIVVGGRPGVGKSLFGAVVADFVTNNGGSVLCFSMEMPRRDWGLRLISARTQLSISDLRRGSFPEDAFSRIVDAQQVLTRQRLLIDDRPSLSVQQMRTRARRVKRKYGLNLIVVDYLQLATGEGQNRTAQVGSIAIGLKCLAKDLAVPIVALAQLSRAPESRGEKRPVLSDLRESGDIEAAADVVLALHREADYTDDPTWKPLLEARVLKNRAGPKGDVVLLWDAEHGRIENFVGRNPREMIARPRRAGGFEDGPRRLATRPYCEVD